MRVKIYQINPDRDTNRIKFFGMDALPKLQGSKDVDASRYDEVFNAELEEDNPEAIYSQFNAEGHPLHRGHSLSVSDVVVNDHGAFFCNNIGFWPIQFDESRTHKPDNLMRIVYVEPHKPPYVAEIEHTLRAEQKAVGGLIELINNGDGTCLVGNEEAKLLGMEGNRHLYDGSSVIAGAFFVCGLTEGDFRGLTDDEMMKYMDMFAKPEDISQEEVESDMGITFYSM